MYPVIFLIHVYAVLLVYVMSRGVLGILEPSRDTTMPYLLKSPAPPDVIRKDGACAIQL